MDMSWVKQYISFKVDTTQCGDIIDLIYCYLHNMNACGYLHDIETSTIQKICWDEGTTLFRRMLFEFAHILSGRRHLSVRTLYVYKSRHEYLDDIFEEHMIPYKERGKIHYIGGEDCERHEHLKNVEKRIKLQKYYINKIIY